MPASPQFARFIPSALLMTSLLLAGFVAPPELDLEALAGATPAEVALVGGDVLVSPTDDEIIAEGLYAPAEGGSLTVVFCDGRAISVERSVGSPEPVADALLAKTGLRALSDRLELTEESETHLMWVRSFDETTEAAPGGEAFEVERLLVLHEGDGWSSVELDFSADC